MRTSWIREPLRLVALGFWGMGATVAGCGSSSPGGVVGVAAGEAGSGSAEPQAGSGGSMSAAGEAGAGGLPECLGEACGAAGSPAQQCDPGSTFCSGSDVLECEADGSSSTVRETCGAGSYCEVASATCKEGACAPDQPACDGSRATICNDEGTDFLPGGTECAADDVCDAGQCVPQTCAPSENFCWGGNVHECSSNGLHSTIVETCPSGQFCHAELVACQHQICQPGVSSCEGSTLTTCNAEGSDTSETTCSGETPVCVAELDACVACKPGDLRCTGQQPQECEAGLWQNAGAACSGGEVCDLHGDFACTKSPTVPGGTFQRRSGANATVAATVSSFRLDRFEVTVGEFRAFVEALVYETWSLPAIGSGKHTHLNAGSGLVRMPGGAYEAGWPGDNGSGSFPTTLGGWISALQCDAYSTWPTAPSGNEDEPVNCVNWFHAYAYCMYSGGFLPSEAEWEYAFTGGTAQRTYPWGAAAPTIDLVVWSCLWDGTACSPDSIAPVGSIPAGNALWSHADMAGNLDEWVLDFGSNPTAGCSDCAAPPTANGGIRGGRFTSTAAADVSVTRRASPTLLNQSGGIGFRCARSP